jgi:hypothetical protein
MRNQNPRLTEDAIKEMLELGIERVSIDYFYFKEYRYTDLKDAVAQAKRQLRPVARTYGVAPN